MQFLFAELGTSGSVDGSRRLVIKGRFQQKQIENVLRRYIGMFNSLVLYGDYRHIDTNIVQLNTSPARPAAVPTPSSTRVRTVYTSSPATLAVLVVPSPPSRLVSVDRSAAERDRVKWVNGIFVKGGEGSMEEATTMVSSVVSSGAVMICFPRLFRIQRLLLSFFPYPFCIPSLM